VPVHPDDTEDTLAARVLATEHQIYPRAVRWFVEGALAVEGGVVLQRQRLPQWFVERTVDEPTPTRA
jgi:phosphoribosylglycinamide formyltransferase-1